jgi:hypothetical protein
MHRFFKGFAEQELRGSGNTCSSLFWYSQAANEVQLTYVSMRVDHAINCLAAYVLEFDIPLHTASADLGVVQGLQGELELLWPVLRIHSPCIKISFARTL